VLAIIQKSDDLSEKHNNLNLNCANVSACAVEAMQELGENDWIIVPGFTINPSCKNKPVNHVWVRKESLHFDPFWPPKGESWEIEKLPYYRVIKPLNALQKKFTSHNEIKWGDDILRELSALASKWNLSLANHLE
jgi:hypothetical protein